MRSLPLAALLLCACPPSGPPPEHGTELKLEIGDGALDFGAGVRPVLERRLAAAHLRARVFVDGREVAVRVPDGGDPTAVAEVLLPRAQLRICGSPGAMARALCALDGGAGVALIADEDGRCQAEAVDLAPLRALFAQLDAGLAVEHGPKTRGHVRGDDCLALRADDASPVSGPLPTLRLLLSPNMAEALSAFTAARVGQRLLVLLDDEVLMAPVVLEPLRGKTLTVALPGSLGARAGTLAAVLSGGELPPVALRRTRAY